MRHRAPDQHLLSLQIAPTPWPFAAHQLNKTISGSQIYQLKVKYLPAHTNQVRFLSNSISGKSQQARDQIRVKPEDRIGYQTACRYAARPSQYTLGIQNNSIKSVNTRIEKRPRSEWKKESPAPAQSRTLQSPIPTCSVIDLSLELLLPLLSTPNKGTTVTTKERGVEERTNRSLRRELEISVSLYWRNRTLRVIVTVITGRVIVIMSRI